MSHESSRIHDELLVLEAQGGDEEAVGLLVRRWHGRLCAHALRLAADPDLAQEAVQDAWLAIVAGLQRLADPARFRGWAYRIVTHKVADRIRDLSRRRAALDVVRGETRALNPELVLDDSLRSDETDLVRVALARLDPQKRTVLSLYYLDELGIAEIATALDLPEGTVKSRLFHARLQLRESIERIESTERTGT